MGPFLILIAELLFIAILQSIIESILGAEARQIKIINIACIAVSYVLLFRYIQNHLWYELVAFVHFTF